MKNRRLLSCFLSVVMLVSTFTALPYTAFAEDFNDTVVQTVFELNAEDILAGNVPAYVNVNTDILDTENTSAENGVLSETVSANTNFIQIDFNAAGLALPGTDLDQYSFEIVTDLTDSDDTTKNGIIMYMNTATVNDLVSFRARETSDFCVVNDNWAAPNWNTSVGDGSEAHYTITDLKLTTGEAASHLAQRMTANGLANQYSATVAHDTPLSAWSAAPIKGITLKVPSGYRASIDTFKITRKASFTSTDFVKESKTVYEMNVNDVLAGETTSGVVISNVDTTKSSAANGLISNETTSSTDFMTITFADLPQIPGINEKDETTPIYDVNMEFAFVDEDDTTKNGAWMFFDEVKDPSNMLLRIRETRDGTIYNNGSSTINNGTLGKQNIPTIYYKFKINTDTGLLNQHFMKSATEYIFGNVLSRGNDINLNQSVDKIILKTPNYTGESYRVVLKSLKITRTAYIENAQYTITATSESEDNGTVAITGLTDGKVQKGSNVTLTATPKSGYIFKGWYKAGEDVAVSTERSWTFTATEDASYVAKFLSAREVTQTVYELDAASLEAGTVPTGVTLNTSILNETATTADSLVSDVVTADTAFLTIDLDEVSKTLPGEGTGIYTIEIVTNVNDSDDTTNNGTTMFLKGIADTLVLRARENSDICAMPNTWTSLHWQANTGATASYIMENLNVTDGSATAHYLKRDTSAQYNAYANGHALAAGNATEETPISVLTVKAANGYRANIKSLKIKRKALVESATCTVNATTENAERGSVSITGVSQDEETLGQVQSGSEVTLTATRNSGYLFKGWYKGDSDIPVSTDSVYTFIVEESANYTARFVESYMVNKVMFELDASDIVAGEVPAGVTFNSEILDEAATTADSLVSDVVTADTAFLTIDLANVGINTGDLGGDIYTIEIVTNVNDSDDTTKNGTTMFLKGIEDIMVLRARENSDICAMPNTWTSLYWQANTGATATYIMEELDVTDGSAKAHHAKRGDNYQYSAYANGCALAAGNASEETPISILTVKAAKNYRANIKSLKITRQVELPLERVNVEVTTENDAYGIVTDIGDTAIKYSEVTLTAEAKEGYIFAGWYDGNALVSEEETWTFQVLESFSYTARFRKVIEEWVEVYGMNIADILAGATVNGVAISNLDTTNSSPSNGLLSNIVDTSTDFMTITFANLQVPEVAENDILTDIFRVDMKLNLVDEDDTTKNGALVYYNEAKAGNMLLRARETRDGTVYKDGSATVYGTLGQQKIPVLAYNFKMDTDTSIFNQYVKHGVGDYYIFSDTLTRGDNITLPASPESIIIRNADYNSGGVNEDYRVNIKSLSVKRLVKVVDTGNAVPVFSKDRVSVIANNGEVWSGYGAFTTNVEKIIIDFGSEIATSQITNDTVFITCNDEKIDSTVTATTGVDGITLATITGVTFEDGKTYKIIADGIKNTRGASLQKVNEYVAISTESGYESIFVKNAQIGGNAITEVANITANTDITINVEYTNVSTEKDVYVIYVAYSGDTMADIKMAKLENVSGSGNGNVTITTGDVTDVEAIDFIIWEGWSTMRILDSFGF